MLDIYANYSKPTKDIGLGIQSSTNYFYNGDVGDIVIFERTLNDAEIATLDAYFKAKQQNTLKDKSDLVSAEFLSFTESHRDEIHVLEYTADASAHTAVCQKSSYTVTEEHSFAYSSKDENAHIRSCSICGYECVEEHNYQAEETVYKCLDCGAEKQVPASDDNKAVIIIASVSAAVVLAVVVLLVVKKKK